MKQYLVGTLAVLLGLSIVANFLLYMRYSTSRPLVTVGDQVIRKVDYQGQLEQESGKLVLNRMVFTSLIMQAAAKAGVTPTDADINSRIQEMERRSPQMVPSSTAGPARLDAFKASLKTDMALENLRIKGVTATEKELQECYEKNKKAFALPTQVRTTLVVTDNAQDAGVAEDDLKQGLPEDVIARQPRLHVAGVNGFNVSMDSLPTAAKKLISNTVMSMKVGDVRTMRLGSNYLTFKEKNADMTNIPSLSAIRDQVARVVKLQKGPSAQLEIATLYQTVKPKFAVDKYEQLYFQDVANADLKGLAQAK
jgi:hypothetical protein